MTSANAQGAAVRLTFDFFNALGQLRLGKRVARESWNRGLWLDQQFAEACLKMATPGIFINCPDDSGATSACWMAPS